MNKMRIKKSFRCRVFHFAVSAGCLIAGILLSVFLNFGCESNPFDPNSVPAKINVTYSISRVNDTLHAYCFFPITFAMQVSRDDMRFVDSIFLREAGVAPFHRLDESNRMVLNYAEPGEHEVTVRWFLMADRGAYRDTVFVIRTSVNYAGVPVNAILDKPVELRAVGIKYESVNWHWDLSRIGLGVRVSSSNNLSELFAFKARYPELYVMEINNLIQSYRSRWRLNVMRRPSTDEIERFYSVFPETDIFIDSVHQTMLFNQFAMNSDVASAVEYLTYFPNGQHARRMRLFIEMQERQKMEAEQQRIIEMHRQMQSATDWDGIDK